MTNFCNLIIMTAIKAVFSLKNCSNGDLCRMIRTLLDSTDELQAIASRSYVHVNQFVKITLQTNEDQIVRLHIWLPSITSIKQNPHTYGWGFCSRIISGIFVHTLYERTNPFERVVVNKNTDINDFLGLINSTTMSSKFHLHRLLLNKSNVIERHHTVFNQTNEIVELHPVHVEIMKPGDEYELSRDACHTMIFMHQQSMGITLIVADKKTDDYAFLYSNQPNLPPNERKPCLTVSELTHYFRYVLSELEQ